MSEEEEVRQDGRRKATDEQIVAALSDGMGVIAAAAYILGNKYGYRITRSGLWRRIHKSAKLRAAQREAEAEACEKVESALLSAIKKGNVRAMIFFLQSRCDRYRPTISVAPTSPLPRSAEELRREAEKYGIRWDPDEGGARLDLPAQDGDAGPAS